MNALLWMTTGIAIGWLANTLSAEARPEAVAVNMIFAVSGALLGGWMFAPAGSALLLQQENYSAGASVAALIGAVLVTLGMRGLLTWLRSSGYPSGHAVEGLSRPVHRSDWSVPLTDTGPDTVPSGHRVSPDVDSFAGIGARQAK